MTFVALVNAGVATQRLLQSCDRLVEGRDV
jgi:hypothetical protein